MGGSSNYMGLHFTVATPVEVPCLSSAMNRSFFFYLCQIWSVKQDKCVYDFKEHIKVCQIFSLHVCRFS